MLRPTFALANVYLARATVDEGTPQEGEGYVSLTSPAGLSSIVDHQETALRASQSRDSSSRRACSAITLLMC